MKLYAEVTSERASKGQGGNKYLEIVITDENKDELMRLEFDVCDVEEGLLHFTWFLQGERFDDTIPYSKV